MLSSRAILSVKYTPVSRLAPKAIGGFLRYVQHRDHHETPERERGVAGLVRYVAYRDAASPDGRLFDRNRTVGTAARGELVRHVRRSLVNVPDTGRPGRAVYRFVLSPEDARGLDLRRAARAVMEQLERDAGGKLPPWLAAEHRNTAHPHVHIILAARREDSPGRFRELRISPQRLAHMKLSLAHEIERQRAERTRGLPLAQRLLEAAMGPARQEHHPITALDRRRRRQPDRPALRFTGRSIRGFFRRLAFYHQREAELQARKWERDR
jgi:hypothetical protein